ncbi:MAG: RnfABCDGE type electron transport complex subunit A [Oscillospiraceae bacterium]|jgi:electron transport complex protein RnfA|nr:RnfABCDGE type electron transport complex subunit A [Oscillospiraceae bacterium]
MKELLAILFSAILVDNFVLSKFMGICPFIGVSKKTESAMGMSVAVTFVMVLSTALTYPIYKFILVPNGLEYLNTMAFILIIALFVQLVEILIRRFLPPLYKALGIYLPLITTNCAVLGVTLLNIEYKQFGQALVNALGAGLGFTLALLLFSGVRERIDAADVPKMFKGVPSALVAAGIVAASFVGFGGLVENLFG